MKQIVKHIFLTLSLLVMILPKAKAQTTGADGTIIVEPLFVYPEAPNYIDDLASRSDYLMDNFWKEMNFKQKVVNQAALQHAFEVYAAPMRWAQAAKVQNSVKDLLKKVSKNPTLATQIMKAAEETFHSPRSEVYIDEVYEMFLRGFIENKKVKSDRKKKYEAQLKAMQASRAGMPAPTMPLTDSIGNAVTPRLGKEYSVYVFGSAHDSNLRQLLLKLNTNMSLERLCNDSGLGITYINVGPEDGLSEEVMRGLPAFVTGGYCPSAAEIYDLRFSPSVYLLDEEGKIIAGNLSMQQAFDEILRRKFSTPNQTMQ